MKKIIIVTLMLAMLLACATSCGTPSGSGGNANSSETDEVYGLLNDLVQKEYEKIRIDVVSTTDFAQLCSNYVITKNHIVYSIEQLNLLSFDGADSSADSNYKNTVSGYALVKDGKITELDGDKDVKLPSYNELKGKFNFNQWNFKNTVVKSDSFEAEVISPSKFYGTNVDVSNFKINVKFSETELLSIVISYRTENATVKTTYAFES